MSLAKTAAICVLVGASLLVPVVPVRASSNLSSCPGSQSACARVVLGLINHERAENGLPPLKLARTQSRGTRSCVGSLGHSLAMALSGAIWHTDRSYPQASFPRNICVRHRVVGENVGQATGAGELEAIHLIHDKMMSEPHSPQICASSHEHACIILRGSFQKVGIGIYYVSGTTWLTEDFTG